MKRPIAVLITALAALAVTAPAATAQHAVEKSNVSRTTASHSYGGHYWPGDDSNWNIKSTGKARYTVHSPRRGKRFVTVKWARGNWYTPNGHNLDCADSHTPISSALLQSVKFRFVFRDSYGNFLRGVRPFSVDCRGGNDNGQSKTIDLPNTRLYVKHGYWPQMRVYTKYAVSNATDAGCPPGRTFMTPPAHGKKAKTVARGEKGSYCHTP